MAKLDFVGDGKRTIKAGIEKGVLYTKTVNDNKEYAPGVATLGLISVTKSPEGGEAEKLYAENGTYAQIVSKVNLKFSFECYAMPPEFDVCDGIAEIAPGVFAAGQAKAQFGLVYNTKVGSDVDPSLTDYEIHIIYNALAGVSEFAATTMTDSVEAQTFSYDCETTELSIGGNYSKTATIVISSKSFKDPARAPKLQALEDILYGTDSEDPRLPLPEEIITLLA